ncbi:hypothetical protein EV363DRAFT_1191970, partial [Boletus edulis]
DLPWVSKSSTLRLECFYPCPPCHRERSICLTWPAVQLGLLMASTRLLNREAMDLHLKGQLDRTMSNNFAEIVKGIGRPPRAC